ncbi:hypothetical protein SAMN05660776_2538 [Salegentibacter holothuriorum]|uniref:Redox-active disulfide protein 2 n=1 Tax=Salegentibacter holothuriorum TaxID=241145 RepID=A0A1T5D975_9FLAO|nr:hypothetical protein [Salegentibacter holothuriorum]SKB68225.1 hypothetical protein SAMN05660776_2538 [Salegentibacter holothuriorum]
MNQKELSGLSLQELKNKHTAIKILVWILAIVLMGSFGFFIFISIRDGLTPLIAVPFALATILPLNFKNLKLIKTEIASRTQ